MHDYHLSQDQSYGMQPQPRVNQMAPASAGAIDPRMVSQMLRQMTEASQPGMSTNDGINLVIASTPESDTTVSHYPDAYSQQAEVFGNALMAQSSGDVQEDAAALLANIFNLTRGGGTPHNGYQRPINSNDVGYGYDGMSY